MPKMLKPMIKAPMVLILGFAGVCSGMSVTSIKFILELFAAGNFMDDLSLIFFFGCIVVINSTITFSSVNICMKYYDQIDVMPTYFAQILIWSVFSGLILLNEIIFYSRKETVIIIICSLIAFTGIQILAMKSNQDDQMRT